MEEIVCFFTSKYLYNNFVEDSITVMICSKVIVPNKVIFSYFDFSYQNKIILENSCIK